MNEVEMVTISAPMLQAVADLLRRGGSRLENDLMADRLVSEANAPLVAARQQAEFNAAVAAATEAATKKEMAVRTNHDLAIVTDLSGKPRK